MYPQNSKHEDRKQQQQLLLEQMSLGMTSLEKPEKKERGSKAKDKSSREKSTTEEEKELRKERKLGRKRVCTTVLWYFGYIFCNILMFLNFYIPIIH